MAENSPSLPTNDVNVSFQKPNAMVRISQASAQHHDSCHTNQHQKHTHNTAYLQK